MANDLNWEVLTKSFGARVTPIFTPFVCLRVGLLCIVFDFCFSDSYFGRYIESKNHHAIGFAATNSNPFSMFHGGASCQEA